PPTATTATNTPSLHDAPPISTTQSLSADTTAPTVPGLTATAASSSQINLSWSAATDPTVSGATTSGLKGYKLYRNGVYLKDVLAPGTSTSHNGLNPATAYSYT